MRRNKRKPISIIMALAIAVTLLPAMNVPPVKADVASTIKVGNSEALDAALDHQGSGWSYDASAASLTLTDFNYSPSTSVDQGIEYTGTNTLTIELNGANTINVPDKSFTEDSSDSLCGIYSDADIIIKGSGSLTITTGAATNTGKGKVSSYGIYSGNNVFITGGVINATGGDAGLSSAGIYSEQSLIINNATVTAQGGNVTGTDADAASIGLYGTVSTNISATVTATGGKSTGYSEGIYGADSVSITGGVVTAAGDEDSAES